MAFEIYGFNHVSLHVADLDACMHFYGTVLGLHVKDRPDFDTPGCWYVLDGDRELHLTAGRTEPIRINSRRTHFSLSVASVDEAIRHLDAHNVKYLPARLRPDGAKQLFVRDPEGYFIELCELPKP
jgi:catechol 2,3-dioxygenase-like lactoylglutathione lyase family enzyme